MELVADEELIITDEPCDDELIKLCTEEEPAVVDEPWDDEFPELGLFTDDKADVLDCEFFEGSDVAIVQDTKAVAHIISGKKCIPIWLKYMVFLITSPSWRIVSMCSLWPLKASISPRNMQNERLNVKFATFPTHRKIFHSDCLLRRVKHKSWIKVKRLTACFSFLHLLFCPI